MTTSEAFFWAIGVVSCFIGAVVIPVWLIVKFETMGDARREAEAKAETLRKELCMSKRNLDIVRAEVEDLKTRGPYR